jgi:hypothetical protein
MRFRVQHESNVQLAAARAAAAAAQAKADNGGGVGAGGGGSASLCEVVGTAGWLAACVALRVRICWSGCAYLCARVRVQLRLCRSPLSFCFM